PTFVFLSPRARHSSDNICILFEEWIFSFKSIFSKLFKPPPTQRNTFYIMNSLHTHTHTHTHALPQFSGNNTHIVECALVFSFISVFYKASCVGLEMQLGGRALAQQT
ncbi:mCG1040311, partial [Mus musculus]